MYVNIAVNETVNIAVMQHVMMLTENRHDVDGIMTVILTSCNIDTVMHDTVMQH